jgi:regulatory protein
MIVTKIERQKRHPDRVNIHLDGVFAFGLDEEVLLRHGLRKGDAIDERTHRELLGAEAYSRARAAALRYLSYRLRSEREIRTKLAAGEVPPGVIDRVVEALAALGLVDDRRFASAFVHDARLRKPTGERLLRQQLAVKGVPRTVIDAVLAENTSREEDHSAALEAARALLRRYRASRKHTDDAAQRRRVAQFLVRRGFEWSVITPVLRAVFGPSDEQCEDTNDGLPRL